MSDEVLEIPVADETAETTLGSATTDISSVAQVTKVEWVWLAERANNGLVFVGDSVNGRSRGGMSELVLYEEVFDAISGIEPTDDVDAESLAGDSKVELVVKIEEPVGGRIGA